MLPGIPEQRRNIALLVPEISCDYADSSLAEKLLGFRPQIDLRGGLEKLLRWYTSQDRKPEELLKEDINYNWTLEGESKQSSLKSK